jgi:hypothetical protein
MEGSQPGEDVLFFSWKQEKIGFTTAVLVVGDSMYIGERKESFHYTTVFGRRLSPVQRLWLKTYYAIYHADAGEEAKKLFHEFEDRFGLFLAKAYRADEAPTKTFLLEVHSKIGDRLAGDSFYEPRRQLFLAARAKNPE